MRLYKYLEATVFLTTASLIWLPWVLIGIISPEWVPGTHAKIGLVIGTCVWGFFLAVLNDYVTTRLSVREKVAMETVRRTPPRARIVSYHRRNHV